MIKWMENIWNIENVSLKTEKYLDINYIEIRCSKYGDSISIFVEVITAKTDLEISISILITEEWDFTLFLRKSTSQKDGQGYRPNPMTFWSSDRQISPKKCPSNFYHPALWKMSPENSPISSEKFRPWPFLTW